MCKTIVKSNSYLYFIYLASIADINSELYPSLKERGELQDFPHSHFFEDSKINRKLHIPVKFKNDWDTLIKEKNDGKTITKYRDQLPIFEDLFKALTKDSQFDIKKQKGKFLPDYESQPDFLFITKLTPITPYNCPFVVELQLGEIDGEHKCRVLLYNQYILRAITWRKYIISAVSDLDKLILLKTIRDVDGKLKHYETNEVDFWNEGIYILNYMINNYKHVGFDPSMNISGIVEDKKCFIYKFLGKRSSKV